MITVGSATPKISKGWPPMIECMMPHTEVDAKVWTAVRTPSASAKQQPRYINSEQKGYLQCLCLNFHYVHLKALSFQLNGFQLKVLLSLPKENPNTHYLLR